MVTAEHKTRAEVYLQILLYRLLEDSGCYVSCNLSDFHLSWKGCFYLEVIIFN